MTADFGEEAWRFILLPVYLTAYRYDNRVFQVLVNGQSGDDRRTKAGRLVEDLAGDCRHAAARRWWWAWWR